MQEQTQDSLNTQKKQGPSILEDEICEMLRAHEELDTTNIQVEVAKDTITLVGFVPEAAMKQQAETLVQDHAEGRQIKNLLKVKLNETIFP